MQRDESHRLPLLLLLDRVIPSARSLHLTDDEPDDTAGAAGCSPKAAPAAGNVPRRTVYSRARQCTSVVDLAETCDERIECLNER